jgi:hypothetical protein
VCPSNESSWTSTCADSEEAKEMLATANATTAPRTVPRRRNTWAANVIL